MPGPRIKARHSVTQSDPQPRNRDARAERAAVCQRERDKVSLPIGHAKVDRSLIRPRRPASSRLTQNRGGNLCRRRGRRRSNSAEDSDELVDFGGGEEAFYAVRVNICVRGLVEQFGVHVALLR